MNYDQLTKKEIICVKHKKAHFSEGGWRLKDWETEEGIISGWGCDNVKYPEFVPQHIHDDRVTYANDQIQSHRGGELSREFLEAHPKRAKEMLKNGVITKEQVKKSKRVWGNDIPGMTKKVDAETLIK